jgi:hypothetical protein
MPETKIKDYLRYYITQGVIIFPIHLYQEELVSNIVKSFDEWGLLEHKKISCREKYFKYFLNAEIDHLLNTFRMLYSNVNVKVLTVYKNKKIKIYTDIFIDVNRFNQCLIKTLKTKTKYFKEIKNDNLLFINTEGNYKGLKIGKPSGEEIEFIQKTLAKQNSLYN